jgi:aryl-alcohol dehydrogenase-like predicted oxidoreductase
MKTTLGKTTLIVPRLGVGAMTWGDPKGIARFHPAKTAYGRAGGFEEEKQAFETALAAGINFFDTAAMYSGGASERRLGQLLVSGHEVLIASKFPGSFFFRVENFPKELAASLARLGRSYVDLYQHHFPSDRISIPTLMDLVADAVDEGKIRAVGVSNYSARQMREAHAALARHNIPLASNQVEYSLLHRRPETDGVLDACRELGITLIAYQPLAMGALAGKYINGNRPTGLRRFMPYFRGKDLEAIRSVVSLLREIGERYDKTPPQMALRWLLEKENVVPIPGARNARQVTSNAGALTFSLTAEEVEALDRVSIPFVGVGATTSHPG